MKSRAVRSSIGAVAPALRVHLAVAPDKRQTIIGIGIRPPIGSETHVVVLVPAGWSGRFRHDGERTGIERVVCLAKKMGEGGQERGVSSVE